MARKSIGKLLVVVGVLMLLYYWKVFDISVPMNPSQVNSERIVNAGLMQDRLIGVAIAIALGCIGVALQLVKQVPSSQTMMGNWLIPPMVVNGPSKTCPRCAYVAPVSALRCPQCGLVPSTSALVKANAKPIALYSGLALFFVGGTAIALYAIATHGTGSQDSGQSPVQQVEQPVNQAPTYFPPMHRSSPPFNGGQTWPPPNSQVNGNGAD